MPSSKRKKEEDMPKKAGPGASLPDEMITEVLQWLPVKSVLRFQAVCRSWAALLSSDEFRSLHMAASRAPQKLLYISPTAGYDSTAVYSCPLSPSSSSSSRCHRDGGSLLFTIDGARGNCVEVVSPAPCRGLILLYDAVATAYYICNAATRAAARLPPSPNRASNSTAGLGFDARTKEYKVVRLIIGMPYDKEWVRCEVYTPGGRHGDCWRLPVAGGVPSSLRQLVASAILNASFNKLPPVFANGSLHWLLDPRKPGVAVISFSITEETFACIPSPPFWVPGAWPASNPWSSGEHLVEMDSRLCLVRDLRDRARHGGSSLEIWQLLDDGGWSLNHRINFFGQVARDLRWPEIVIRVVASLGNSSRMKIIIASSEHKMHSKYEKKVHVYDPRSEALETVLSITETHSSPEYERPSSRFSLFEETLSPVHKTNEEIVSSSAQAKATREILLRLPAKSAIHSKLICKQWLRLIQNQNFMESYSKHKNIQDRRLKVMLVGKGTGQSGFSFAPLNICLQGTPPSHSALLDRKVVCSKPCHGLNLVSTETKDYLCNPCTGFHRCYSNQVPNLPGAEEHAFTVGNKNVGLTFDPLTHEHVAVEIFYRSKDFKSRQYDLRCALRRFGSPNPPPHYSAPPPLPVNDMPPAYLEGVLYWMSEPRNRAFVVELAGELCAVLADPVADSLDVWKLEHGQWARAYTVHLKACPDYSLEANVVVPLAVDPDGGRILLNSGRKIGLYDPVGKSIQSLYSLDEVPVVRSEPHRNSIDMSSTSSGDSVACSKDLSGEVINIMDTSIIPFIPMLYEESLAYYSRMTKLNVLW
ncbi:unnamed protein product [Alopecurus aequalis]